MQENYKALNLSEDASMQEVETAYKILKDKYSKDRFLEGEAGNYAAKRLTEVENAYKEIKAEYDRKGQNENNSDFTEVEKLLKEGKYNDAQKKLDEFSERNAEWHYLQSVVYYKKNWINESKKQLEIAMNMDPNNSKYNDAYTKLRQKTDFNEQFTSGNASQNMNNNRQMGDGLGNCCDFCATWMCLDLTCHMCCR